MHPLRYNAHLAPSPRLALGRLGQPRHLHGIRTTCAAPQRARLGREVRVPQRVPVVAGGAVRARGEHPALVGVGPEPLLPEQADQRLGHLRLLLLLVLAVAVLAAQPLQQPLRLGDAPVRQGRQLRRQRARAARALEAPGRAERLEPLGPALRGADVRDGDFLPGRNVGERVDALRQRRLVERVDGVGAAVVVEARHLGEHAEEGVAADVELERVGVDAVHDGVVAGLRVELGARTLANRWMRAGVVTMDMPLPPAKPGEWYTRKSSLVMPGRARRRRRGAG
ncbi:hypothetical protein VCV18_004605 [Metarhizium anisopliae]